jgi:5-methylcytosine-specific restriction protein A
MPLAPPRACVPGCRHMRGRCPVHDQQRATAATAWAQPSRTTEVRTRRASDRRRLLQANPICVLCWTAPSTIRDHIVPLAEGGPDTAENTQALCKPCHDIKSQAEAARGVRRAGQWRR